MIAVRPWFLRGLRVWSLRLRAASQSSLYLPTASFRARRMKEFLATFVPTPSSRILDVGGTALNWAMIGYKGDVTLLNVVLPDDAGDVPPNMTYVQGDGTDLPYADHSFDIVFSNSVIEHLHTYDRQLRFALELSRVAPSMWVQTPARWFPVEPHFLAPAVHFLPRRWQRRLIRNFTPWGWVVRPTQQEVDRVLEEYRLMTYAELEVAFPDCEIRRERLLGMTKSFIAVRLPGRGRTVELEASTSGRAPPNRVGT